MDTYGRSLSGAELRPDWHSWQDYRVGLGHVLSRILPGFSLKKYRSLKKKKESFEVEPEIEAATASFLQSRSPWFQGMVFLRSDKDPESFVNLVVRQPEDFAFGLSFDCEFVAKCARSGYLPMAIPISDTLAIFAPKLHQKRCLLDFDDLHIPKKTKKRAKRFHATVDAAFDFCLQQCCKQHGTHCWFYPRLIQAYRSIHDRNAKGGVHGVRMHSIEVWSEDGKVVAGEVGYTVGSVYTSLSGFKLVGNSGSVQLACVTPILKRCGFTLWDLGMCMEYKTNLGAKDVPRLAFLAKLRKARDASECFLRLDGAVNAKELLLEMK